eukprot:CAMPEP_0113455422 /NCGR_PEP_ID=MMETSP0014_2-20120614/8368_1 /TAXON_ID=2857 /ORGANISM="Nitzschia sp." /LENGTH=435 /DNA_ID=CAMNT_0000346853 /DNA_START=122 /DNA_END=1429 /DNA_ORIENTATION=- /assembly_acc=CAM_ASM_000159
MSPTGQTSPKAKRVSLQKIMSTLPVMACFVMGFWFCHLYAGFECLRSNNTQEFSLIEEFLPLINSGIRQPQQQQQQPKNRQSASSLPPLNLPEGVDTPRAFAKWTEKYPNRTGLALPCFPSDYPDMLKSANWRPQRADATRGLLFNKLMKCGSSTASGIHVRLALKEAKRQAIDTINGTHCMARWGDHNAAKNMKYHIRDRQQSMLWTIIREPTRRWVSHFFFFVVSKNRRLPPTDDNFEDFLNRAGSQYYLKTLETVQEDLWNTNPAASINNIMSDYDFIGIMERMEESAVAFMMLLNLTIPDILYFDAKSSGTYDDECDLIQPSFVSPRIQEVLKTDHFQQKVEWDAVLYKAVNRSLDLTIESLGTKEFEWNLHQFQIGQAKIKEICKGREVFSCSINGKRRFFNGKECLWKDSGCGQSCIQEAIDALGWEDS